MKIDDYRSWACRTAYWLLMVIPFIGMCLIGLMIWPMMWLADQFWDEAVRITERKDDGRQ